MKQKKIQWLLLVLIAMSVTTQAQQQISFEDAYNKMQKQNLKLQSTKHNERYFEMKRRAAVGRFLPKISLSGYYAHLNEEMHADFTDAKAKSSEKIGQLATQLPPTTAALIGQMAPALSAMIPDKYTFVEQDVAFLSANMVWPLFTGGKLYANNKKANMDKRVAEYTSTHTNNQLITELTERYYGLRLAEKAIEVRQEVLSAMERHLSDAKKMEENGILSEAERLHAEVARADAFRELQIAKSKAIILREALNTTLSDSTQVYPSSPLFLLKEIEGVQYFQEAALASNPQLMMVEQKRQMAKLGKTVARADYMPMVAAIGNWRMWSTMDDTGLIPEWLVGVSLKWTIFDGASRTHNYIAATEMEKRVSSLQQNANADIKTLVTKHYNELQSFTDQLVAMEVTYKFASEYVRVRKKAFSEGFASSTDVVDAELMLSKIKIGRLSIMYQYDVCLSKLLEASGLSHKFNSYRNTENVEPENFK